MSRSSSRLVGASLLVACFPSMGGAIADPARDAASSCATGSTDSECDVVDLLQHGATRHMDVRNQRDERSLTLALIDEVYTYGAPATHSPAFQNAATKNGCFPGLRSYTENLVGAMSEIHQIDAAAMNNYYWHAYTNTAVLHDGIDSLFYPCNDVQHGNPDYPQKTKPQHYEHWPIHREPYYQPRLNNIKVDGKDVSDEEPFNTAKKFVLLAWRSYENVTQIKSALSEKMPDWSLVAREVFVQAHDEDPVLVVQQEETLDCALVFTGSNYAADYPKSTTQYGTSYCGFDKVHKGYRDELWSITVMLWPKLRPALEQCNRVACVGHSLGGALCELFSACANSGNTMNEDFQLLAWEKAKSPTRMPSIEG